MFQNMKEPDRIQLVAFSTHRDTNQTPCDIFKIYLRYHQHTILKKNNLAIAFTSTLPKAKEPTKIFMCSVDNLNREYNGITNVNCYIILVDLEKPDSKEKITAIINYLNIHCDTTKKIYVLGLVSETVNEEEYGADNIKYLLKNSIEEMFDSENLKYDYKQISLENSEDVSEKISEILIYSTKIKLNDKKENNAVKTYYYNPCNII